MVLTGLNFTADSKVIFSEKTQGEEDKSPPIHLWRTTPNYCPAINSDSVCTESLECRRTRPTCSLLLLVFRHMSNYQCSHHDFHHLKLKKKTFRTSLHLQCTYYTYCVYFLDKFVSVLHTVSTFSDVYVPSAPTFSSE